MNDQEHQSAGWQLEQRASEAYEQYLVPPLFAPWAERLLDAADLRDGDRLLDVACGTGIVARSAASRVGERGSIVGLDINEGMLAVAAETTETERRPAIEWRRGDAIDLPFPKGRFDVACCQQALQFVDEPSVALEEMHRVLASGGRVALSVWRPLEYQPGYVVAAEALERHIGDEAGAMMRSPFPAWEEDVLRTFAREAGFDDVSITIEIGSMRYPSIEEFVRREAASSPLAEPIAGAERTVRDELIRAVEDGLDAYTDDDGVVFPMESYRLTARG
ncbi:methyltransferase domain-containing protein [Natronorubrum sp. JWXQ-INN-674]|uniref:Methyltransferase domain-containing protein n=1 Tax=Natronorubrum halalkaliphilum TaxID=2691917 RepID=A0A6B0VIF8_9EURY|nr:methyltransferase domain-containing protein [Natronorubrum halalkaliphilum]MXV61340.1 methyltransferase domain-containing protein [Natronorubrum halalkaliphilum]